MNRAADILRAANPIAALFGPLFQKEVRTAGRRRSTYVMRVLYCLGLLLILTGGFLAYRSEASNQSAALNLQAMQKLAPTMTLVVGWFQFVVMLLASPVLAAGSICDERRARSLDVLMTTPMTAGQIVLGKLSSRIVQVMILALLATPGLLAVRVFGGLSAEVIAASSAVAISTAVLGAALAVLFSVRQKRATMAALFGLLSLLLLQCGPAMVEGIRYHIANEWVVESPYRQNILATCSPGTMSLTASSVLRGEPLSRVVLGGQVVTGGAGTRIVPGPAGASFDLGPMWVVNALYNLLLAAMVTLYTTLVLRRAMKKSASREGMLAPAAAPLRKRKEKAAKEEHTVERPAEPEEAHERFSTKAREVSGNPVLWREVRQPTFGSRRLFRIVVVLTIVGLGFLYWQTGLEEPALHAALAFIGCAAVMFQAVFLTAGPFAGEREARTWDVLLTTTLSPRQILWGKLAGVLRGFWFVPTVVTGHFVVAATIGYVRPIGVLYVILIMLGPALLLTATGTLLSLRFKKAVTAGALNLGLAVFLWALLWLSPLVMPSTLRAVLWVPDRLGLVKADLAVDKVLDDYFMHVIDGIYAVNPIALMDTAINPTVFDAISGRSVAIPPFDTKLLHHKLNMTDCTIVVACVFGFYAVAALGVTGLARARFKAWSGRTS